ncbi:MAG: hypothetical protein EZS28_032482 [Streblomastix strix]|uniref:Tail fiber protein n=1 Tax=Streblomastix strix TaxID=222440 RepID=A0A5J4UPH2_9EUKA|nr:MAG: hypothetical protein EZS28_032482 [Streblomastix strix]
MGFFSKIANFGSMILGGVKHAAQWIAPTPHKVLSTVAGPAGMIHPGIGGALGAGANLAGAVDRLYSKRGGNSGGVYAANNQIIDGQASDFALKIAADGLLTVKNLKVLNFVFVAQINQLINEINLLQSTVGSIDADIVEVKNDIDIIKQNLARQQHFRGYYLLNSDITSLPDSADGDFAFSDESGTEWMYDTAWYNSGQVVPDQVTHASDAVPLVDNAVGAAGISTEYARGDHQHPLQISSVLPSADTATGEAGTANTYARSDRTHHVNLSNNIPLKDIGTETAGTSNIYASAAHQHLLNVDPTVANVPLVNATAAANGTSDYYCRNDHVHPQQLTYDGNITATKFNKTGGLATEILCANGDTITIDSKLSRTYTGSGWIRLCVFPAGNSAGNPFIEFQIYTYYNFVQTIRLQLNYTDNGITNVYGILTQDVVTGVSSVTVIPINYNYGYGGFMQNTLQVNPTDRTKSSYNNGIRIRNFSNESALYLACSNSAINTVQAGQWEISKTSDNTLTIYPSSLRKADHSVGLSINGDSSIIKFNGNELVNVGTDQTINGRKAFNGVLQINPTGTNYNEGIRIAKSPNGLSQIFFGVDPAQYSGQIEGQWAAGIMIRQDTMSQQFAICLTSDFGNDDRGLRISADGNILTFNGRVQ